MQKICIFPVLLFTLLVSNCSDFGSREYEISPEDSISFKNNIKPVFLSNCIKCHGSSGGLNLSSYADLMAGNSNHGPVVFPGQGSESIIILKLRGEANFGDRMPKPPAPALTEATIDLIETWIDEGALNN
ncbi:MAG: c-type cytochrome domain-containing protein [Candidatus Neomarinimicrobiota bacterium]